jgi:surface polysaccharide O-acyltransferase-like enzyme
MSDLTIHSHIDREKGHGLDFFFEPDRPFSPGEKHLPVFDFLRALACICVVVFHTAGSYTAIKDMQGNLYSWWVGNIYNGLAVNFLAPGFFIISGALLLRPSSTEEPIRTFLKKRAKSILPPFLAASFFYYIYAHWENLNFWSFLANVFGQSQYYHLWFFYTMMGLYLVVPVLRPLITPQNRTKIEYLLVLWILGTGIVPIIQKFTPVRISILPSMFSDYSGYFLFGAYFFWLRKKNIRRKWAAWIFVGMNLITAGGTYLLFVQRGTYDNFFSNQLGLNIMAGAICLVSLVTRIDFKGFHARFPQIWNIIRVISRQSLYIYIFHPFMIENLPKLFSWLQEGKIDPLLRIPLLSFLAAAAVTLILEGYNWLRMGVRMKIVSANKLGSMKT